MLRVIESGQSREFLNELFDRTTTDYKEIYKVVEGIIENVKKNGDDAVKEYTERFDGVKLDSIEVTGREIEEAVARVDSDLLETIRKSYNNIKDYHKRQLRESTTYKPNGKNIILGQLVNPIEKAGIYVPGGKAAYPSTVLMNAVPAKLAGVEEVIMITPPNKEGKIQDSILAAASISGVDRIFKVGGAQGIAALAYGTESIPKVFKITGPGNIYVAAAKKMVSDFVGIDMIAGPSEILVIADKSSNPRYIAADLISQAEHDEMAASILVTDSPSLIRNVNIELKKITDTLERKDIILKSLTTYGAAIHTNGLQESIDITNEIAPEHLEIATVNPFEDYKKIKNAGAIFLGNYTPEPVGDYFAGPNHTLPTSSTAKFSSPLSVDDFIKKTSLIYYSRDALEATKDDIIRFAENEGLTGHANSIKIRFE
ncbi:histidinol dehydrogenase [Dethiosulfatibacter aminovorans DSM 17477]|uniref:Histidinol dehydrogenase n=1 Tax=Dethiosulfatibacter aminovorans DSM 17477 TaxID=1121476 RepID=A0A1M6H401_9FIRM|nr:histidinol dehydrogenase [Dethiosulfatibacter aminovorans]SHJ16925.1 histidinol dehydrogenase [Dethiosulfatibacter aminovorans DSM 17477]